MKRSFAILTFLLVYTAAASAQMAYIHSNRNLMFQSSLHGKSLAWASEVFDVALNKYTGELGVDIPIDGLYFKELNPDFTPTGESLGKVFSIRCTIPVDDVLKEGAEVMDVAVDTDVIFNGIQFRTTFIFSIIKMFPNGFGIQAEGRFPHSAFGIASLQEAEDELVIVLSFKGE